VAAAVRRGEVLLVVVVVWCAPRSPASPGRGSRGL